MLTRILLTGAEMLLGWLTKRHVEGGARDGPAAPVVRIGTKLMSLVTISWTVRPSPSTRRRGEFKQTPPWAGQPGSTVRTGAMRCVVEGNALLWTLWRICQEEEDGIGEHYGNMQKALATSANLTCG